VEIAAKELIATIGEVLSPQIQEALELAARVHDVGKVHEVFQGAVSALWSEEEREALASAGPWAKSGHKGRLDYRKQGRPHFRHELASALALLDAGSSLLDGLVEADLVVYLVGAHHGRIRLGIRSLPDERPPAGDRDRRVALGILDGELLPGVEIAGGSFPAARLDLSVMDLGSPNGGRSWSEIALGLRDRDDLGPFRLAFLEALLRLADWRASDREKRIEEQDE
jgi:CRISPR-associated endonuclease/helicase Cas3